MRYYLSLKMKITFTAILILYLNISVNAQSYAIIQDSDGYTNVRKEGNAKSAIIGKIYSDDIFSLGYEEASSKKTDWIKIYKMQEDGSFLEGYVHTSRILPLSSLKALLPLTAVQTTLSSKTIV